MGACLSAESDPSSGGAKLTENPSVNAETPVKGAKSTFPITTPNGSGAMETRVGKLEKTEEGKKVLVDWSAAANKGDICFFEWPKKQKAKSNYCKIVRSADANIFEYALRANADDFVGKILYPEADIDKILNQLGYKMGDTADDDESAKESAKAVSAK
jgi:hypothetical protein